MKIEPKSLKDNLGRKGVLDISNEALYDGSFHGLLYVFRDLFVILINKSDAGVRFTCISEHFRELKDGEDIPTYKADVLKGNGKEGKLIFKEFKTQKDQGGHNGI